MQVCDWIVEFNLVNMWACWIREQSVVAPNPTGVSTFYLTCNWNYKYHTKYIIIIIIIIIIIYPKLQEFN